MFQISKSTGQIMAKLEGKVKTEEENEFHLTSKDFLRPPLKQIGRSIAEIKSYFGKQGIINIVPSRPNEDLVNINDDLVSRIRGDGFLFKENIVKGASSETCKDTSGLVLLTKSAVPTFNLPTLPRTLPQQCDIFVAVPQQPPLLLTVVGAFPETKDVRDYNAHLTREVTAKLRLFTSESFNIVHGIICRNDLKDSGLFQTRLRIHAMLSSFFLPQSSFSMNRKKYDQVVTAFWAVIAETKSVFTENGDPNDMVIRFLTKEQCLVLVENMNNNHVQVRCETGSGATTLMLEVARRLSRLGETLLVCRSKEERDRLRSVHPSTISLYDVGNCDLSKFENVVHDTHAILHETSGRHWQFLRDPSTADLKKSLASVETVVNAMDSQLEAMKSEEWKQKMNYMQSEMDVLRLFHQLTGSHVLNTISHKMNMLPEKSSKDNISLPSLDLALEPDVQEPHLVKFMEGIQHQKDPFPILRLAVIEGKTKLMYLTAKTTFLEKATEASGDTHHTKEEESLQEKNQSKNVQQCLNTRKEEREKQRKKQKHKKKHPQKPRHRRSSKEEDENCASPDVSKQHPPAISETQGQLQNTGADERQWSFDGTDKLKERLESLERARDENIRQLVPLLSVEWQNTLGFLKRNTVTLSWFGEDTKRFDYDQLDRHGPLVHETHSDQEDQEGPQIDTKSKKGFHSDTKEVAVPKGHDSTRSPFSSRVIGQQRCKHDSPVHQLRNFQLGRLDVMCIYKMLGRMTTAVNTSIAYLQDKSGHMEKAFGCPLHLVGELDSTQCYPVSCPVLFLDAQRVNQRRWHVTSDGKLVNAPPSTQRKDNTGLEEYSGTCSHIPILLPPDLLTTTSVGIPHTAQYWETHSHVGIVGGQGWPPILEMGLSEAGLVDSRTWVCNQPRSWCVAVWRCKKHGGKICTRTYEEGDFGGCMSDTMSDIPGTQATLHYGLVLDVGRGRLAFIDLNRKVVLAKYDVQFRDTLYPMFGVWRRSEDFSVALKLISGVDVTMSDTKRTLICQSLQ
ncbi:uncharacterized protein LOC124122016 isoform X2 [Haliotis rufescens]|uniref:uncharacterized protein LOC124122016 isoform X2 n=1 Tax=Haliotis rufescens TaxID=6454 RepID=UPI001EB0A9DA|nr:uncharacterized protein LOC124122016 isoform X2 [Haliotis rufescens]